MKATRSLSAQLLQVKKNVTRQLTRQFATQLPIAVIRRGVDEAEQLAQCTGFPHLVFPLLAEEIVARVSHFLAGPAEASTAHRALAA